MVLFLIWLSKNDHFCCGFCFSNLCGFNSWFFTRVEAPILLQLQVGQNIATEAITLSKVRQRNQDCLHSCLYSAPSHLRFEGDYDMLPTCLVTLNSILFVQKNFRSSSKTGMLKQHMETMYLSQYTWTFPYYCESFKIKGCVYVGRVGRREEEAEIFPLSRRCFVVWFGWIILERMEGNSWYMEIFCREIWR